MDVPSSCMSVGRSALQIRWENEVRGSNPDLKAFIAWATHADTPGDASPPRTPTLDMFNQVLRWFVSSLSRSFVQLRQRQGPGLDPPRSLSWAVFIISNDPCCRRSGAAAAAGLQSRTCTAPS